MMGTWFNKKKSNQLSFVHFLNFFWDAPSVNPVFFFASIICDVGDETVACLVLHDER